jgi:hypothetical protein
MTATLYARPPRSGAIDADVPLSVVPALAALARCHSGVDAMSTFMQIPDVLLPMVTYHAACRSQIKPSVMRSLIQLTGQRRLNANLGAKVTKNIIARFM